MDKENLITSHNEQHNLLLLEKETLESKSIDLERNIEQLRLKAADFAQRLTQLVTQLNVTASTTTTST